MSELPQVEETVIPVLVVDSKEKKKQTIYCGGIYSYFFQRQPPKKPK